MSGFALIFDLQGPIALQDRTFIAFRESVARYKQLDSDCWEVSARQCVAAKFDTPSSLHKGIVAKGRGGSWMLAVGTVLDSEKDSGDLHALLSDYLSQGSAALQSLDGPFALVVYDKPANRLAVVSDPLGLVSVFHARRGDRIYVATSALAVAKAVQATPSEFGVHLFLATGNVFDRFTLWEEVERLPAATVLGISHAGSTRSVYWAPVVNDDVTQLSLMETVDYSSDLLSCLMVRHLKREGTTWADLTGGFDSRLVTAMMCHCGLPFKATCEGPVDSPDVRISSRIARELGWAYQHAMLPDNWGQEWSGWLPRALGQGDGHLDLLKTSRVLWDQDRRAAECHTSIWGLAGELWRGTMWAQELWSVGKTSTVNYDRLVDYATLRDANYSIFRDGSRFRWIRNEIKSLLKSAGDRHADSANTVQLDQVFVFMNTGHTGGHISAVMGKQRVLCPLYFKDAVVGAMSTHFRWRKHSRLVRLLLERIDPVLAGFETTSGGPALPMRATNMQKFIPYWSQIGRKFVRKTSRAIVGRSLLPEGRTESASYPLARWRRESLDCLEHDKLLDHDHMRSGRLYDAGRLAGLLERARTEGFNQEVFLSRILTVEMALRSVGASL